MLPFDRTGWGLAAWNLAVLVGVLAVTLGTAVLVEARARDADIEHELQLGAQREMVGLLGAQGDDERDGGPEAYTADTPDLFAFWVDRRGAVIRNTRQVNFAGLPDQAGIRAALAGQEHLADRVVGGVPVRLLSVPAISEGRVVGAVQVGTSLEPLQQAVSQRATIFVLTGLAGAVLAGAGSIFLADRAVRPIREALERQRRFLADASHELRTPVAVVRARAEVLARETNGRPTDEKRELLQLTHDADELGELLNDLLDLARLDAGAPAIALEPVALTDVAEEIVAQFQPIAAQQGVELTTCLSAVWARANLARLRQVVRALVDNALRHTPAGGRILLETADQGHWAIIRVVDTGEGIAPEHLSRVQDRFYRSDAARARPSSGRGAGLGLSIATELVRLMHGELRIESHVGQGTTLTVHLPLAGGVIHPGSRPAVSD